MLRASLLAVLVLAAAVTAALPSSGLADDVNSEVRAVESAAEVSEAAPEQRALLQLAGGGVDGEVGARACYYASCYNACRALGWAYGRCIGSDCWCFRW